MRWRRAGERIARIGERNGGELRGDRGELGERENPRNYGERGKGKIKGVKIWNLLGVAGVG